MTGDASVRWGIIGAGRIVTKVLDALGGTSSHEFFTIGSRDGSSARRVAHEFGIPRSVSGYAKVVENPDIDAVYVATPNATHAEWIYHALDAGKHVLCEKPIGITAAEVKGMFDLASRRKRLLVEAFMYRYNPQIDRVLTLVAEGAVGQVQVVRTNYSFQLRNPKDIRLNKSLGGGSLKDLGCYCVHFSRLIGGTPVTAFGLASPIGGEVDDRFVGVIQFDEGITAYFDCGFTLPFRHEAEIIGTTGSIVLTDPWFGVPANITIKRDGSAVAEDILSGNPYVLQFDAFKKAVHGLEGPLIKPDDSVENARALETLEESARSGERQPLAKRE